MKATAITAAQTVAPIAATPTVGHSTLDDAAPTRRMAAAPRRAWPVTTGLRRAGVPLIVGHTPAGSG